MFPEYFHLMRPFWLFTLFPVLIVLLWLWRRIEQREKIWHNVCDSHLLPHLLVNLGQRQKRTIFFLLGTGWLLSILVLAGPTWSKQPAAVYRSQPARVLILDLSKSMNTKNRLVHAKLKIGEILNRSQNSQTALLVFAGGVHTVSPLTNDVAFIRSMLPVLNTNMPVLGKQTHLALQKAVKLLEQSSVNRGQIILMTAGLDAKPASMAAARTLRTKGHRLSILAINTSEDASQLLRNLAKAGEGVYTKLTADDTDIKSLLKTTYFWDDMMNQQNEDWQEQGYLLLLPLLLLVAFGFRRGWLFGLLVCIVVSPQQSYALNWDDLWLRQDQQVAKNLVQESALKPAVATANLFDSLEWKGIVYYRAGEYQQAVEIFQQLDTAQAHYNRGNALVHLEKLAEAVAAYKQALERNPEYREAQHNLEIVKQLQQTQLPKESPSDKKAERSEENLSGIRDKTGSEDSKISSSAEPPTGEKTTLQGDSVAGKPPDNSQPEPSQDEVELTMEQWLQRIADNPSELWTRKLEHQRQK